MGVGGIVDLGENLLEEVFEEYKYEDGKNDKVRTTSPRGTYMRSSYIPPSWNNMRSTVDIRCYTPYIG
jgi:hypothetical protein